MWILELVVIVVVVGIVEGSVGGVEMGGIETREVSGLQMMKIQERSHQRYVGQGVDDAVPLEVGQGAVPLEVGQGALPLEVGQGALPLEVGQ